MKAAVGADLAAENARLKAELEGVRLALRASEVLHDVDEAMERVVEVAARLTPAERVSVMLVDEARGMLYTRAWRTPDGSPFGTHELRVGEGVAGWVARHGRPHVMRDRDDPLFTGGSDIRAMLCVPMMIDKRCLGVLGVGSAEAVSFTEEQIHTLSFIAARAALAIENARLVERERMAGQELARKNEALKQKSREFVALSREVTRANETLQEWLERLDRANRSLGTLFEINQALSQTLDQNEVLDLALARLETALADARPSSEAVAAPARNRLAICMLSEDRGRLYMTARRGAGRTRRAADRSAATPMDLSWFPGPLLERVLDEGEPVYLEDTEQFPALRQAMGDRDIRSLYVWPILVGGETIGLLIVGCPRTGGLGHDERRMVSTVAGQIAVAAGNARLYNETLLDKELLEAVIRSMGDGMITMDWKMTVTSMNAAAEEITGWTSHDAVGRPAAEVFLGAGARGYGLANTQTPLVDILRSPELSERGLAAESVLRTRDGREIYVESVHSIFTVDHTPLGGVVVFRDVTQKVTLAQQKMDYVASLSHDIRTPLSAVKGYALTLVRHEAHLDAGTRHEFLTIINSEIDRLARLLDNLLNFTRMEVGRLVANLTAFKLAPVIKRVLDLHTLTTRKHVLHFETPADFPNVLADVDQVEQVLNNLVSNAIKYSPQGGDIRVTLARDEAPGHARVTVADQGVGIDAEQVSLLFQRYQRIENRKTRGVSGTGLGLFITRNLVEAQGGRVKVESAPNEGSRFSFTLPLDPGPAAEEHESE